MFKVGDTVRLFDRSDDKFCCVRVVRLVRGTVCVDYYGLPRVFAQHKTLERWFERRRGRLAARYELVPFLPAASVAVDSGGTPSDKLSDAGPTPAAASDAG